VGEPSDAPACGTERGHIFFLSGLLNPLLYEDQSEEAGITYGISELTRFPRSSQSLG